MHVTLIRLSFKNDNCNKYHLLQQLICALQGKFDYAVVAYVFGLSKIKLHFVFLS